MIQNNFKKNNNLVNESEIDDQVITVGSKQSYKVLITTILVLVVGIIYYFYSGTSEEEESEVTKKEEVKQNIQELKDKLEEVPDRVPVFDRLVNNPLPPLPPIIEPQNIPEVKLEITPQIKKEEDSKPTEISPLSKIPPLSNHKDNFTNNIMSNVPSSITAIISSGYPRDRRSAQMMAISGSGDSENKLADVSLVNTSAQQGKATRVGRLDRMITQGKIIDAILETAISSDLQGTIRAMVSRDVYAEAGDIVLIPKGSKLIGGYSFDSNIARARISINWNRIILPHGIDVAIASQGTDELGRAGIAGIVDNKIVSALFSSVLIAGVSISSAVIGNKISGLVDELTIMSMVKSITANEIDISSLKDILEVTDDKKIKKLKLGLGAIRNIKNATSENNLLEVFRKAVKDLEVGSGYDKITLDDIKQLLKKQGDKSVYENSIEKAINEFSKDVRDIIDRNIDKKPTIYVDQGTAMKVFVNQDIIFPQQAILH